MSRINFLQRLIEHPACLMIMPVMRVKAMKSPHKEIMHRYFNVVEPYAPDIIKKLLGLISECVVCGAKMHPLARNLPLKSFDLKFTCKKPECVKNKEVKAAMGELSKAVLMIHTPNQKFLF